MISRNYTNYAAIPSNCDLWEHLSTNFDLIDIKEYPSDYSSDADDCIRKLKKCNDCGQLYFYEMLEYIDWDDGNDPVYRTFVPVLNESDADKLASVNQFELLANIPQIRYDWPKDKSKPTITWVKE